LGQVRLARMGLGLEAAHSVVHRGRGVDTALAARLTPANVADSEVAPPLVEELPDEARSVLGDLCTTTTRPGCGRCARGCGSHLGEPQEHGAYPHTDAGVEVRRIFHELRSRAIENYFNEQFKGIFDGHAQVPTKGLYSTPPASRWGAVFVYQLALLYRHQHGQQDLRVGLKAFLKAA
jgi:hypothetical protein